jgi:hypothetical protein
VRNCFPSELAAGDSLQLQFSSPEFPASDGWDLSILLRGPESLDLVGTPDGDVFTVELTTTQSAGLTPGRYRWFAVYSQDSPALRTTARDGTVDVATNPTTVTGDQRSWAAQKLAALEAALLVRPDASSYTIGTRTYSFESHAEMLRVREALRREVAVEDGDESVGPTVVFGRFGRAGR